MKLSFLGAAGTVTGSKYLIEAAGKRYLVDCGLFQGLKPLRLRNWEPLPLDPGLLDGVLLTHAHLDHSGYLPLLVRNGFGGPVWCSQSTADLCQILLPDSGYLQERDAEFANRQGYSKHKPALPLYDEADARKALDNFRIVPFGAMHRLDGNVTITFRRTGHILGASSIELNMSGTILVFSGDLGRYQDPIFRDPDAALNANYLVVESTYGDRLHDSADPEQILEEIIARTAARGGTVLIPAFAVGRAQSLLFHLHRLKSVGRLANIPVFLDSPMAIDASEIFCRNFADHTLSEVESRAACGVASYVRTVEQSKALNADPFPKVIISASGMATGGRVLHHLKQYVSDQKNTILFSGFQAPGTRGALLLAGAEMIRIHGKEFPVRASIENLSMLSAHGDANEIMRWCRGFRQPPRMTFVTHGEPEPASVLSHRLEHELGWRCVAPRHMQTFELS
jgi:metallo-beta-lactamase family protein